MIKQNFESYGLYIHQNFISVSEENNLIEKLDLSHTDVSVQKGGVRSSIKRYGSSSPYKNQIVSTTIPDYLDNISTRIANEGLLQTKPNSVSINTYYPGNAIAPHIDSLESGPIISILSLLSDATMVFTQDKEMFSVIVPRRSLLQLKDSIRYNWQHSILPVSSKRYSVVFRLGQT